MSTFADDNFTIKVSSDINTLKASLEDLLNVISNWFKALGLKVNMSSSAYLSHRPKAEHLKDFYHYLPSNLLANLLTIPSMYKPYTLE